jgi:diketogulonate reductase-like aldo/keto reductase
MAFAGILRRLRVARVDLALVHWPGAAKTPPDSPAHAVARKVGQCRLTR